MDLIRRIERIRIDQPRSHQPITRAATPARRVFKIGGTVAVILLASLLGRLVDSALQTTTPSALRFVAAMATILVVMVAWFGLVGWFDRRWATEDGARPSVSEDGDQRSA